jgi:hypothetical protein
MVNVTSYGLTEKEIHLLGQSYNFCSNFLKGDVLTQTFKKNIYLLSLDLDRFLIFFVDTSKPNSNTHIVVSPLQRYAHQT